MTRPRFDPNPMPLWLWITTSCSLGLGVVLLFGAVVGTPVSRWLIGCAGFYIASDAYFRLWGKGAK